MIDELKSAAEYAYWTLLWCRVMWSNFNFCKDLKLIFKCLFNLVTTRYNLSPTTITSSMDMRLALAWIATVCTKTSVGRFEQLRIVAVQMDRHCACNSVSRNCIMDSVLGFGVKPRFRSECSMDKSLRTKIVIIACIAKIRIEF